MSEEQNKQLEQVQKLKTALSAILQNHRSNSAASQDQKLEHWFKYHPASEDDRKKYDKINEAAKAFAKVVFDECFPGQDQDMALWLIRQAKQTANSSIACKGV
jgi:hypothetical protein